MKNNPFRQAALSWLKAGGILLLSLTLGAALMTGAAWAQTPGASLPGAAQAALEGGLGKLFTLPPDFQAFWPYFTYLAFLSAGAGLAWRAGFVPLGLGGQAALGALGSLLCARLWSLPWYVCSLAGAACGFLWGLLCALLHTRARLHLGLTGWLLSVCGVLTAQWALGEMGISEDTLALPPSSLLPQVGNTGLNPAVLFIGGFCLLLWLFLRLRVEGFEIKVLGASPAAARLSGVPGKRYALWLLSLCGALAGLGGGLYPLCAGAYPPALSGPAVLSGLEGLTAAVLSNGHPLGSLCASAVMAFFSANAEAMEASVLPRAALGVMEGAALLMSGALALRNGRVKLRTWQGGGDK